MIVCSCNVLSDGDVVACLSPGPGCPRTPAQVYQCLGCSPNCGRCARSIRAIMDKALQAAHEACTTCPVACAGDHGRTPAPEFENCSKLAGQPRFRALRVLSSHERA